MQFSTSIASVLLPKLTVMVATKKSPKEISDLFIRTGRLQCVVMSFILSGFIVFGKGFIELWAGHDYSASFLITLIFFAALFVPLIQNTGISILQARNQMKFRSLLYVAISLVSLGSQIILAKRIGALGCAVAIGGALIIGQGIAMNIYYSKKQSIDIKKFWIEIGKMLFIPALLTIVCSLTNYIIDYSLIWNLIIGISIFSAVYIILAWNFSLNSYERQMFYKPISRLIK